MQLEIEINNLAKSPVGKLPVERIVDLTIKKSGYKFFKNKNISLSFAWVGEDEIKRLNELYRKKNKATDVLSFCEYEDFTDLEKNTEKEIFLGELVLCYDYIKRLVKDDEVEKDLKKELARIIAHGVLHLLCFHHGKKMFFIQNEISESF